MRLIFSRVVLAAFAFFGISGVSSQEAPSRPQDVTRFHSAIFQANQRGDFDNAVRSAEDCLAFEEAIQSRTGQRPGGGSYCAYYLSSALRSGKGAPRDVTRAFHLLITFGAADSDGAPALNLAEMYLDGEGTARDPVEAAILVWRVEHGSWSKYSPYWGMCTVCEDYSAQERSLDERLARDLSVDELQQAAVIERIRFPMIVEQVKRRDAEIETATASLFAAIAGLAGILWMRRRSAARRVSRST
jgi:hypothetical protein